MQTDLDFEYLYKDREEAYKELFELVPSEMEFDESWEIVTPSINNLPQVCEISDKLNISCEPFFVEEITAPNNTECAIASVSELKEIVIHKNLLDSFEIGEDYVYDMSEKIYNANILTKIFAFKLGKTINNLHGKNIMMFLDSCETGLNTLCVIKSLLNQGVKKIFIFIPIISEDLYQSLDMIVDRVYASHRLKDFIRTSYYYEDFSDVDIDRLRFEVEKRRTV